MGDYISKELCEEQAEYDVNHNLVIPLYKIRRMPAVDAVGHDVPVGSFGFGAGHLLDVEQYPVHRTAVCFEIYIRR